MKSLHALLIGINDYPTGSKLGGCIADMLSVKAFLDKTYPKSKIQTLIDAQATRKGIMEAVRAHAKNAKAGDTFLLYYSGHGGREAAPKEFHPFFPEKENETILCYDSRLPGGYDLADKELAALLTAFSPKVHVIVWFDCCHSGSGTRDTDFSTRIRREEGYGNVRALDTYLEGFYTQQLKKEGKITLPAAPHIVLSACKATEVAYERNGKGVFTQYLLSVLEATNGEVSYGTLFDTVQMRLRQNQEPQTPQVFAYGGETVWKKFLTGQPLQETQYTFPVFFDKKNGYWCMEAGALQGLHIAQKNKPIEVTLLEENATKKAGKARIEEVKLSVSILTGIPKKLNKDKTYKGVIGQAVGVNPTIFSELTKEENARILPKWGMTQVSARNAADFQLLKNGEVEIVHRASNKILEISSDENYLQETLGKIVKWENLRQLKNPQTHIPADKLIIEFDTFQDGKWKNGKVNDGEKLCVEMKKNAAGKYVKVPYRIHIANQHSVDLHVALLLISPLYGIYSLENIAVPVGTKAFIYDDSNGGMAFIKGQEKEQTSLLTYLFICSTSPINSALLEQVNFSKNIERTRSAEKSPFIDAEDSISPFLLDDWTTASVQVQLMRVLKTIDKSVPFVVNGGIEILPHSDLVANVSVESIATNTRGVGETFADAWMQWGKNEGVEVCPIMPVTRGESACEIVTLTDIQGAVSYDNPLKINYHLPLKKGENIVPVALDGEVFVPIGISDSQNPQTIRIHNLPQTASIAETRSVSGALKFCLFKMAAPLLRKDTSDYFLLRCVTGLDENQKPMYEGDEAIIRQKVKAAQKILLLIHGIIGDTEGQARFAYALLKAKAYDVVLTFDYENLNTEINDISYELKRRLVGEKTPYTDGKTIAGIGISNQKKIDILAHSMGGLVSRHMIEQREGNQFVNRLIMCGTPNAGSVFGKIDAIRKWAGWAMLLGANAMAPFSAVAWGASLLKIGNTATGQAASITKTLAQMDKGSTFLFNLNKDGKDSKIPYIILAGNVQKFTPQNRTKWESIQNKGLALVGNLVSKNAPNDIAVMVEDIKSVGKNTQVKILDIPCHHLNYFDEPHSVAALMEILGK